MLFGKQAHYCFSSLEFGSPLWKLSAISAYTCLQWKPQTPPSPSQNETLWFYTSLCLHQVTDCVSSPAVSCSPLCSMYLHLTKTNTKALNDQKQRVLFNADKSSVIVVCLCEYVLYWQRASVLDSILIRPVWEPDTLVLPFMMTEFTNLHLDTLLAKWLHRERARERDYLLYCILVHFYDILIDIPWTVTSSIFFLV